ncbi:MAG: class I SAM-dependent methyltransferase [Cyanobacteria bacterium P01_G01_bin.54]
MDPISESLRQHYFKKFALHGASPEGVDWGSDLKKVYLRYEKMLAVLNGISNNEVVSLLDVGCGYGGLLQYLISEQKQLQIEYTGIDVAENMISWAMGELPAGNFLHGNIFEHSFEKTYDYVVCSGILTQKLEAAGLKMDAFASQLIRQIFSLCRVGIAFNVMSTKVNYYSNNLYYRNPVELISWCSTEITTYFKIDHSYPLYEYTIYLYRNPVEMVSMRETKDVGG